MPAGLPILDSFSALADRTRCRMLWLLAQHELTVSELCSVLQLPQSTVSRQLKILGDADWVTSRRDGTSRYYRQSLPAGTIRRRSSGISRGHSSMAAQARNRMHAGWPGC